MKVFMSRSQQHDCQKLHLKFEIPWNKDRLCEHFPNRSSSDKDKWVMPEPVAEKRSRICTTMWHWPSQDETYDWGDGQIQDPVPFFSFAFQDLHNPRGCLSCSLKSTQLCMEILGQK